MSAQKAAAISKARAASIASNGPHSPRVKGVERAEKALLWVYRFGWSTPTILELALDSSGRSGIGNRLVKSGLLVKTPTPSGGINNTPSCILTLSRIGLELITALYPTLLPYEINPLKIKFSTINHDENVQRLTANRLRFYYDGTTATSFLSEKELAIGKKKGDKIPDAIWNLMYYDEQKPDEKVAVEVELSAKWGQELDTFVYQTLYQLTNKVCDAIEIYSNSPALLERYAQAFKPNKMLQTWNREPGKSGRWSKASPVKIPERPEDQVRFIKITPDRVRPRLADIGSMDDIDE